MGQIYDLLIIPNMVDEYQQKLLLKAGLSPMGIPVNERIFISQVHKPTEKPIIVKLIEAAEAKGGGLAGNSRVSRLQDSVLQKWKLHLKKCCNQIM